MQPNCSVIFLAGGGSSRMGSPKAWLEFDGRPLLNHLVERMLEVFPEVVVVAAPEQELPPVPVRIVADKRPGEGPLAGLEVGLREVTRPLAFVSSCDAPFLSPAAALQLAQLCEGYDAVVPRWQGRLQPLHAVYRASLRPLVSRQLTEARRRMTDFIDQIAARIVDEDTLQEADPSGRTFLNMNSPEDYRHAQRLWRELHRLP
ncbi:MAG: molybdenum cofactor guanylyltransferase [Actinomycetota bacterium]